MEPCFALLAKIGNSFVTIRTSLAKAQQQKNKNGTDKGCQRRSNAFENLKFAFKEKRKPRCHFHSFIGQRPKIISQAQGKPRTGK